MELMLIVFIYIINFIKGYKSGERDSCLNNEKEQTTAQPSSSSQPNQELLYLSDDELRYLVSHTQQDDYPYLLEQILDIFSKYRILFLIVKSFEMILSISLLVITYQKRELTIATMQDVYKDLNANSAHIVFYIIFYFSVGINCFFYPFGFYALTVKNLKLLKIYSGFTILVAVCSVLLVYINL
jgi:hypothetical protein